MCLPPGASSSLWMDVMKELFCSIQRTTFLLWLSRPFFNLPKLTQYVLLFFLIWPLNVPPLFDRFVLFFTLRHRLRAPLSAACLQAHSISFQIPHWNEVCCLINEAITKKYTFPWSRFFIFFNTCIWIKALNKRWLYIKKPLFQKSFLQFGYKYFQIKAKILHFRLYHYLFWKCI